MRFRGPKALRDRWDEKAGLLRDGLRSQWFDVLEAQRKGDRRCKRLALCRRVGKTFSKGSSRLGWISEIVQVLIAFWMKQAKSFSSRNCQQPRRRWQARGTAASVVGEWRGLRTA